MQHSRDRDGEGSGEGRDVGAAFADPAFAGLKARGAPFAILRPDTGAVLWANAAAAHHWAAGDAAGLGEILFGPDGRGGWFDGFDRGLVPGRAPRLARAGLARGSSGTRARTALIRAWMSADGVPLVGLALPDADPAPTTDAEAWRRPAWEGERATSPAETRDGVAAAEIEPSAADPAEAGQVLARRGQLAVLRDRLARAVDGAVALRMLWRTDADGAVVSIDLAAFARLGSPLRFDGTALPDAVAPFDPEGAGRLRAALATRATWAGISFDLPVADAAATVPLALSGSPMFGPERAFAGYRGFGTVDLGRLALARRPPPAAETAGGAPDDAGIGASADAGRSRECGPTPPPAPDAAPSIELHRPVAPSSGAEGVEPEPGARLASGAEGVEPEPGARLASGAERVEPTSGAEPASGTEPASGSEELPPEPRSPANVVQLRAFQGSASGRFGAAPVPSTPPAIEPPAALPADAGQAPSPPAGDDASPGSDEAPFSDQLAFLALGEALRARIGAPAPGPRPDEAPQRPDPAGAGGDPSPAIAVGEPASPLLDRLPIAVLAIVGGTPVFANPAAAARLGYGDARALLGAGDAAVVSTDEPDRIALRDAAGRALTSAARRVEVPWAGGFATLWLLSEPDGEEDATGAGDPSADAASAEGSDDRSVELLDRVDDAVALLDAAGRLRRLNRRGEGWFGRAEAEAPAGRGLADLLAPESRPAALALLGEVRNQRDGLGAPPLRRDVLARTGEGGPVPMLLTLGRLGASGFYATLRDVSALKRAETDRTRTEHDHARAAGRLPDLLAKVSHEIRTPLGAILGFAEVMMDERFGPLGNPRYKDYLKDIHASGAQVVALVDDLLDLSRIEAGQLDLAVAAVDVNRLVTEAVAQMQPEAHRGRVIMRTSLAGRIPPVLADERSARQIVKNLLSNAVRFNEPGGQVIVSTAMGEAGTVLLRVRDTGVGMSDEEIAAALEPFGGLPARPTARGNGLGLPLTRALVGANGASMTIRSRPREGTLVEVSFAPAEEGEARRPA